MSKPPAKRPAAAAGAAGKPNQPNWILTLVWAISFTLLLRTCMNQQTPTVQVATFDQNFQALKLQAAGLWEQSAAETLKTITKQADDVESTNTDLVKKGKLPKAEADKAKATFDHEVLYGQLLVADAFLRAGVKSGQYGKYQAAYQNVFTAQKQYGDSPDWQSTFELTDQTGNKVTLTGANLYSKIVEEVSAQNRRSPVWGFIPGFQLVDALVHLTGAVPGFSYWFAALLLACVVRGVVWPLTQKQFLWGRQMAQLAPMLKEIKEACKDDQAEQQKRTMALYSEYGINPLSGCAPLVIQMPLFFAVYQCMLHYQFEFQKGTFAWINANVASHTHGLTGANLGVKDSVLIVLYAITLVISTLLTPVNDPTQVKQQRTIGVGMALLFPILMLTGAYPVPSAFVLYWTFTNLLTTAQSLNVYYRMAVPPLVKVATVTGGLLPTGPKKSWFDKLQEQMAEQMEQRQELAEQLKQQKATDASDAKKDPGTDKTQKSKFDLDDEQGGSTAPKSKPKRRK